MHVPPEILILALLFGMLLGLIIMFVLYFIYGEIGHRIRMHRLYKETLQELDEEEKEIMDKLKENSYESKRR